MTSCERRDLDLFDDDLRFRTNVYLGSIVVFSILWISMRFKSRTAMIQRDAAKLVKFAKATMALGMCKVAIVLAIGPLLAPTCPDRCVDYCGSVFNFYPWIGVFVGLVYIFRGYRDYKMALMVNVTAREQTEATRQFFEQQQQQNQNQDQEMQPVLASPVVGNGADGQASPEDGSAPAEEAVKYNHPDAYTGAAGYIQDHPADTAGFSVLQEAPPAYHVPEQAPPPPTAPAVYEPPQPTTGHYVVQPHGTDDNA